MDDTGAHNVASDRGENGTSALSVFIARRSDLASAKLLRVAACPSQSCDYDA
jgi:hypothetical protein